MYSTSVTAAAITANSAAFLSAVFSMGIYCSSSESRNSTHRLNPYKGK